MKQLTTLLASVSFLTLAACVDTTGLSATSSRTAHPNTDPNAAVTVVEFADLQCPACQSAHEQIVKPLIAKYGTRIRYDFMHFPIQTLHPYALIAAQASECAADQGKFWEFLDLNYQNQDQLNKTVIYTWAQTLGLDSNLFSRCVKSGIKKDGIIDEYQNAKTLGVTGTPTFFVNGVKIPSEQTSLTGISTVIDQALQTATQRL